MYLPVELLNKILANLQRQPYVEVSMLIEAIKSEAVAPPEKEPEVKPEDA
jgi:hypothetical protein